MLQGIYSSAAAMNVNLMRQDAIAHNLANINVPGFHRTIVVARQTAQPGSLAIDSLLGFDRSQVADAAVDWTPGSLKRTDRPLDLALDGPGFFTVQSEQGLAYTRSGGISVDTAGQLVVAGDQPLLSGGRPIVISPEVDLERLVVGRDGTLRAGVVELGQLDLVDFANPAALQPLGSTLYAASSSAGPQPFSGTVVQSALEQANTSAISELVQMISGMRAFEAAQRSLRSISQALEQYTTLDV